MENILKTSKYQFTSSPVINSFQKTSTLSLNWKEVAEKAKRKLRGSSIDLSLKHQQEEISDIITLIFLA